MTDAELLDRIRDVVRGYRDTRGHDNCHWHPERLDRIAELLALPRGPRDLPRQAEFETGCAGFTQQLYGRESATALDAQRWRYLRPFLHVDGDFDKDPEAASDARHFQWIRTDVEEIPTLEGYGASVEQIIDHAVSEARATRSAAS